MPPIPQSQQRAKSAQPPKKRDMSAEAAANVRRLEAELANAKQLLTATTRTNSGGGGRFRLLAGTHTYCTEKNPDGTWNKDTQVVMAVGDVFETDVDMVEKDGPQRWVKIGGAKTRRPTAEERPAPVPQTERAAEPGAGEEFDADAAQRESVEEYLGETHDTESEAAALVEGDDSPEYHVEVKPEGDGEDEEDTEPETGTDADGLEEMSVADLKNVATAESVTVNARATKQQIVDAIRKKRSEAQDE